MENEKSYHHEVVMRGIFVQEEAEYFLGLYSPDYIEYCFGTYKEELEKLYHRSLSLNDGGDKLLMRKIFDTSCKKFRNYVIRELEKTV